MSEQPYFREPKIGLKGVVVYVYLGNRRIGEIYKRPGGFQYKPKGVKQGGDFFPTLGECKKSLGPEPVEAS